MPDINKIEHHPLQPFLPKDARLLMLGSFPPQRKRWSMDFFYPNIQNDMWRIFGLIFFDDKNYFYDSSAKQFKLNILRPFLEKKGIAIFDTAKSVIRLQNNASDKSLQIVEPTNIMTLLETIPQCHTIVVTGQKAADLLSEQFLCTPLSIGKPLKLKNENFTLYRMPSSSRSYPLALNKKATFYRNMFEAENLL